MLKVLVVVTFLIFELMNPLTSAALDSFEHRYIADEAFKEVFGTNTGEEGGKVDMKKLILVILLLFLATGCAVYTPAPYYGEEPYPYQYSPYPYYGYYGYRNYPYYGYYGHGYYGYRNYPYNGYYSHRYYRY